MAVILLQMGCFSSLAIFNEMVSRRKLKTKENAAVIYYRCKKAEVKKVSRTLYCWIFLLFFFCSPCKADNESGCLSVFLNLGRFKKKNCCRMIHSEKLWDV